MKSSVDVIFEDNHLLVINKPAGLITQGAPVGQPSVINLVADYLKEKYNKPGNVYVGIVSRLDALVSGVLVVARTSKAAARLNEQFKASTPKKIYMALTPNRFQQNAGRLEHKLVKNERQHRMEVGPDIAQQKRAVVHNTNSAGQTAILEYKVVGTNKDTALVEIQLITGRKHQIRVQLASCGCPIHGDLKYGSDVRFKNGIALHCRELTIQHPTLKEPMTFAAPPPKDWKLSTFA